MKSFQRILVLFLMLGDFSAIAGESGFLYNGREYITFKDGKKVGQNAHEVLSREALPSSSGENRIPANSSKADIGVDAAATDAIFFQRHNGSTCFFLANHSGVSCVRN